MAGFSHDPLQTINLIADNLRDRYKSGFPVLKEIIQNSDDAGCNSSMCLDFGFSNGLQEASNPLLKGPALFFLNDGSFKATDALAIKSFGLNKKAADASSIGKFGLGMKSVFHFCEAFFYFAKGEGKEYQVILNPWDGGDDYPCRHPSWNEFVAADQQLLRCHLSSVLNPIEQQSDAWFLLWLPLRKKEHLEDGGGIITEFPGDDLKLLDFLNDSELPGKLAELLPLLRYLTCIRYWYEGDAGFAKRFHVALTEGARRLAGVGDNGIGRGNEQILCGKSGDIYFTGHERHIVSESLGKIRQSPLWPRSYVRDEKGCEQQAPDKAEGHAAVVFSRRRLQRGQGELRIRWAVFLPLEGGKEALSCPGEFSYLLTLHGYFFVDAGRVGIDGFGNDETHDSAPTTESELRRQWNQRLINEAVLPLVLSSLEKFVQQAALSPEEVGNLCQSLNSSELFKKYRKGICAESQFVAVRDRSGITWKLLSANSLVLPLPPPPQSDQQRPWSVFPALAEIEMEQGYTLVDADAPSLRSSQFLPQWNQPLLERLLDGVRSDIFADQGQLDYFHAMLTSDRVRPFLGIGTIQQRLRHVIAAAFAAHGESLSRLRKRVQEIVSLVNQKNRLTLTITSMHPSLNTLHGLKNMGVLLVPRAFDAPGAPGEATLNREDATVLLQELDRILGVTKIEAQKSCRDLIKLTLEKLAAHDRQAVLQQLMDLRLIEAYDCKQKQQHTVSLETLNEARDNGLLFRYASGLHTNERLGLAHFLQEAITEEVFVIQSDMAKLLLLYSSADDISSCTAETCLEALGRSAQKIRSAGIPDLIQRLAGADISSETQRRGLRYLLHGNREHFADTTTTLWVRGHEVSTAWEKLWQQVQEENDGGNGWNLLRREFVDRIPQGRWSAIGIKEIRPEAILEEVRQRGTARLDGTKLSMEERNEILAHIQSDEQLWFDLPLHETLTGEPVRVTDHTYLAGSLSAPDDLADCVVVIKKSDDTRVKRQQDEWLIPLDQQRIAEIALDHQHPQLFWREIMAALVDAGGRTKFNKDKVRRTQWLPTRQGEAIAPEHVILLPEIEDELDRLAAREKDSYLPPARLIEEVRSTPGYEALQSLFSAGVDGLEKLGLLLDGKNQYFLGKFSAEQDENKFHRHIDTLAASPGNLGLPGWRLLQRLGEKHGLALVANHVCQTLFQPIDGQRLVEILQWLKERHDADPRNERAKLLATYNWTLAAFAKATNARSLLSDIFLQNKDGHWKEATKLCTDADGIADNFILDDDQRNILRDIITDAGGRFDNKHEATGNQYRVPWPLLKAKIENTAQHLRVIFDQWQGQVAPETVCFFLCLLGDDQKVRNLADEWKGGYSLEWYKENAPWHVIPKDDEIGRGRWLGGLSAEEAIRRLRFIVELTDGDGQARVVSIIGDCLQVSINSSFTTLAVGGRPGYYLHVEGWPSPDLEVVQIRLRRPDPSFTTPEQFSSALKKTAEYILENVYDQVAVNLDEFWTGLDKSYEQVNIRVAERLILENIPFYLKQLSVHKRQEQLNKILQAWDDARHKVAEYEGNQDRQKEFQEKQKSCLCELQTLLKKEGGEAQMAVLDAVRAKMQDYQYEPASVPFELFQNADDATAEQAEIEAHRLQQRPDDVVIPNHCRRFLVFQDANRISFAHWGRPINSTGSGNFPGRERNYHQDMEKMLILSSSDKASGVTGKFGLGFKSVLLICDRPRLVSGRLGFEVVAGMCPVSLTNQEEIRSRLTSVSIDRQRPGTLVDLPLVNEVGSQAVLDRFCKLVGGLVVFARQIRTIEIRSDEGKVTRAEWMPEVFLEQDDSRIELGEFPAPEEYETSLPALHFRCGYGGLLLGFGPRGFRKLPKEMPAIWVVAPTKEDSGLGIAVNGEFDLDAGRSKLSGTSEANIKKARNLGQRLAAGFAAFYDKAMQNWPEFVDHARLEEDITPYEFWRSFWEVLTYALSGEASPAKHLIRNALTGDYGLGDFVNSPAWQVLPTGLWGEHAVLTRPRQVAWVLRGLLADEQVFRKAMGAKAVVEKAAPGQVISEEVHTALSRVLPEHGQKRDQWASLRVQDVVAWTVGDGNQVTPETAGELGEAITEDLLAQHGSKEIEYENKSLREYLGKLLFQAESGDWVKTGALLVRVSGIHAEHDDESLRAGFAPTDHRLSSKYDGKAVAFFRLCRDRMKASVEDMAAWIHNGKGDEEHRAALLYLRDGEKGGDLLERLRNDGLQGTWLGELDENSPYFEGWSDEDRDELLLRGLRSLYDLRYSFVPTRYDKPTPSMPPLDPREVLPAIHDWWQREWSFYLPRYEQRVYGGFLPDFSLDDTGRFDRSAWLTLLLLGAFHTMGRTRSEQHRGFIELCTQRGWWQIFSAELPRERASEWMRVLEEYFDQQIDRSEYEHWFKQFGSIYRFARYLDDYVEAFSSLDRPGEADLNHRAILAPRASDIFQGGGIDAPPLERTLGKGFCFVLRELRRKNILQHPGVSPCCFVPVGRVCGLLDRLGADIPPDASPIEQSKAIHDFLAAHLGPGRACFGGHYDIPLQIVAERPDIQYRFFNGNLSLNDLDEEASPYLGMDTEEIDQ